MRVAAFTVCIKPGYERHPTMLLLGAPHDQPGFKAVDLACYCRPFELVNISAGKDSIVA